MADCSKLRDRLASLRKEFQSTYHANIELLGKASKSTAMAQRAEGALTELRARATRSSPAADSASPVSVEGRASPIMAVDGWVGIVANRNSGIGRGRRLVASWSRALRHGPA